MTSQMQQSNFQSEQDAAQLQRASVLLRVGGWIEIVYGLMTFVTALLLAVMGDAIPAFMKTQDLMTAMEMLEEMPSFLIALAVIDMVIGALVIWFGITAVRHHRDDEKITFMFVVGIVLLVFGIFGLIGGLNITSVLGLVGAVCYFLGALFKRKHYLVM